LLRYGIPDFKLEKSVVERRIRLMEAEGIVFQCGTEIGRDVAGKKLLRDFDAVVLATGSTVPRDLKVPGRDLEGVRFAMDFLKEQNVPVSRNSVPGTRPERSSGIQASGKRPERSSGVQASGKRPERSSGIQASGKRPERSSGVQAGGKNVVVIGGGDTSSDCVGTFNRQGAVSITQFELLPEQAARLPCPCPLIRCC